MPHRRKRTRVLREFSTAYLFEDWGSSPIRLPGIGKYAADAYTIFCLGRWEDCQPKDHMLNHYHSWLVGRQALVPECKRLDGR